MSVCNEPATARDDAAADQERLAVFYRGYVNSPLGICYTDPDGRIRDANRAFLALYGYTLEEVVGNTPRILKSGRQSPAAYQDLWRSISDPSRGSWSGELINRRKDGEEIYVHLTISAVRREDDSLIGFVASTVDISARRKLELALDERNRELEQLHRFKNEMVAVTSHDLKAPLHAMISYATLLRGQHRVFSPEKTEGYLGKICEQGDQLLKFIGEMLDLTKIESGKFHLCTTRARLEDVLKGCVEINQAHSLQKGVAIRFERTASLRPAVVDVVRMSQVFNNLLSNAVKHSPAGQEILVTYRDQPGGTVAITFEDQGPGIPDEDLQAIFEPYYQVTKGGHVAQRAFGAGIGLSVVKRIVELHGGTVRVENTKPRGCRFFLALPARTFTSLKNFAALVLDPADAILPYLEPTLRALELSCYIAHTPAEAQRIAAYERPDLLFVDLQSPIAESRGCIAALREADPELTVVAIGEEEAGDEPLVSRTLLTPVLDTEVSSLLQGLLLEKIAPKTGKPACLTPS